MGHVTGNIGGVIQMNKTYDQEGAVFTHVDKATQKRAMDFLQKELFTTPEWLMDNNIFNKIENAGAIERLRGTQTRTLNSILNTGRMQRLIENETVNGRDAYTFLNMMQELRRGIFSELSRGRSIDTYRRNLQRAYIDRMASIMNPPARAAAPGGFRFAFGTQVNVSQSDIRAIVRAELKSLRSALRSAGGGDRLTRIHIADAIERVNNILDPK